MEKLSLFDAIMNENISDATFLNIKSASKYTNKSEEYNREYRKISYFNELIRTLLLIIAISGIFCSFAWIIVNQPNLDATNITMIIINLIISVGLLSYYKSLCKEHSKEESIKYSELKEKIIEDIIELNFKELFVFARNDKAILLKAFKSAKELEVDEDKLELYIKGYTLDILANIDFEKKLKKEKIEEVINNYKKQNN